MIFAVGNIYNISVETLFMSVYVNDFIAKDTLNIMKQADQNGLGPPPPKILGI